MGFSGTLIKFNLAWSAIGYIVCFMPDLATVRLSQVQRATPLVAENLDSTKIKCNVLHFL